MEAEIYKALKAGAIKEVPPDFPHVISPLQVHEKTDGKLRLCFDGRYINLFVNPPTFSNEGPQTIPNWGWKGMWMFSLDHKSGYYHVPLNEYSWKIFLQRKILLLCTWYYVSVGHPVLISTPLFMKA